MKNRKRIAFILSCSLICAMLVPGTTAFPESREPADDGMVISKTAAANPDGTYTIELEAYATGDSVITEITEDVPTDIVLVLDQSGSMADSMQTTTFSSYGTRSNDYFYARRHNGGSGNLWYQLEDGSYVSVSVERVSQLSYSAITGQNNRYYYENRNNIYHLADGEYVKVTVSRSGNALNRRYTYTSSAGLNVTSSGANSNPDFGAAGPLYLATEAAGNAAYTYSYVDLSNNTITIGTSVGANTSFADAEFYQRGSASITRLTALKNALTSFVSKVNEKAAGEDGMIGTADDVNHRIAVVGFASGRYWNWTDYNYGNTEVFIGARQYRYGSSAQGVYSTAFQNMNTAGGRSNVSASIGALDADGGTMTDLGMEMANGILNANPVADGETRNRVVIVFTDGVPGWNGYDTTIANAAITQGGTTKNTYGATVYTVGIFDGADATSAGNASGTETQRANWFMQNLSSNNGAVQNPGYYLSAADADALTNIFQRIAEQIHTGGSHTTLGASTLIRDVVAPAFVLPAGTSAGDIILETWQCTGQSDGEYTWSKNSTAMGAAAVIRSTDSGSAITTNNEISVAGFDFAENWVGTETAGESTTYRGNKLVIKITVEPREGFLGGNQVFTNTSAGLYENAAAETPLFEFGRPTVDVPLASIEVDVSDSDKYLGAYFRQSIPEDALALGATVEIGGYELDPGKTNYGLESWQNEYVSIALTGSTQGDTGSFEDPAEDITYTHTATVTVTPKHTGSVAAGSASDTGTGTLRVFRPKLTYKDSEAYYGGTAVYGAGNLDSRTWVHPGDNKDHHDADVTMLNAEPTLTLSYTPDAGKIVNGTVVTKEDVGVKVAVTMPAGKPQTPTDVTAHTTFAHLPCDPACGWTAPAAAGDPAFLLHVRTCSLTVTKTGGSSDEPYVFTVYRNGMKYTEATIVGNDSITVYELPVGSYAIREDEGWSWRFNANNGGTATLSGLSPTGSITCTNTANQKIYWLNGFSEVVKNTFGVKN